MTTSVATRLTQIAREGVVVDVDLSEWDRRVRFVVAVPDDRLAHDSDVFNVDFVRTSLFKMDLARPLGFDEHKDVHTRWTLFGATVRELSCGFAIQLRGTGPEVELECEALEIARVDPKTLTIVSPTWFVPGQPFSRGTLEELSARIIGGSGAARSKRRDR